MRRHPALQDLSRDHYLALNQVLKVRRVVEDSPFAMPLGRVWDDMKGLWEDGLEGHFEQEEDLLLPHAPVELRDRLVREHAALRRAFEDLQIRAQPSLPPLAELADLLHDHIRWEEAEFFSALQDRMSEEALGHLLVKGDGFRHARGLDVGPAR